MPNPFSTDVFKNMSKPARYTVIAGGVGITGYLLYRHHKNTGTWNPWSAGNPPAADSTTINPLTQLPYSQDNVSDPATGLTYLEEANQYGSVQAAEASVSAYGQSTASGSGIPVNPASPPSAGSPNTVVGSSVYTSNAAWAQAATAGLTDVGYNGTDVAAALGAYLTGTPVTPDQAKIINTAIAEYGPAPVGNLQVILIPQAQPAGNVPPPSPPTTTTVHPPSGTGTVPKPGTPHITAKALSRTSIRISWAGTTNTSSYTAYVTYQGAEIGRHTVTTPGVTITGLTPNHTYTPHVIATGKGGSTAAQGASIHTPS